jgi:hypothetical protein
MNTATSPAASRAPGHGAARSRPVPAASAVHELLAVKEEGWMVRFLAFGGRWTELPAVKDGDGWSGSCLRPPGGPNFWQ